jgi:antitoxin FitA
MAKMIQVRNVSERLHRELMKRAKARGQTLTDYIEDLLEREVSRPAPSTVFERIKTRTPVDLGRPSADLIREERAARDAR